MNRNELWLLLHETEKQIEKARNQRGLKAIVGFAVIYYIILYLIDKPSGFEFLTNIIVAFVLSGIHLVLNATIFWQMFKKSESENKMLNDLRKQLSEMDSMDNALIDVIQNVK